jgi:Transposase DDE domain group 1
LRQRFGLERSLRLHVLSPTVLDRTNPTCKEGKNAIRWTRLSCHPSGTQRRPAAAHALRYNLANFMRTLALPEEVEHWSLTTLREKLVKIGARIVRHGQLAEVAAPRALFAEILRRIDRLRPQPPPLPA